MMRTIGRGDVRSLKKAARIIESMIKEARLDPNDYPVGDDKHWLASLCNDISEIVFVEEWIFPDDRDRDQHDFQHRLFDVLQKDKELADKLGEYLEDGRGRWAAQLVKSYCPDVLKNTALAK